MADNFYERALSESRGAQPQKRTSCARDTEPPPVTDRDILELLNAMADALTRGGEPLRCPTCGQPLKAGA
jgi:hypothetical protein